MHLILILGFSIPLFQEVGGATTATLPTIEANHIPNLRVCPANLLLLVVGFVVVVVRPRESLSARLLLNLLPLTLFDLIIVIGESHFLAFFILDELLINLIAIKLLVPGTRSPARLQSLHLLVLFVFSQFLAPFELPLTLILKLNFTTKYPLEIDLGPAPGLVVFTDSLLADFAQVSLKVSLLHKDFLELSKIH